MVLTFRFSSAQYRPDAGAEDCRRRHCQRRTLSLLLHLWFQHLDHLDLFPKLSFIYASSAVLCRAPDAAQAPSKRPFRGANLQRTPAG